MWNPFKKKTTAQGDTPSDAKDASENKKDQPDSQEQAPKMGMLERLAMKKIEKMSPQEQQKMMQEAFNPKNRDKMISVMDKMKKSGMITEEQYRMAKEKLGF